ncbi:hypothetical protein BDW22DRAFT_948071 [Trametopsis cervina]|nr:hypothetical protein BDW22DRAFT_948071 [Trametopsis cervina]
MNSTLPTGPSAPSLPAGPSSGLPATPFPLDPATIAALFAALIQAENDVLVLKYVTVSSFALLVYDILLTMPKEIELIWNAKLSRGSLLYYFVRYGNLLSMALNLPYYLWVNPNFNYCKVWYYFDSWMGVACVIPITVILTFRTYAVCDRAPAVKYLLWLLILISNVGLIACVIVTTVQIQFAAPALPGFTCVLSASGFSRSAGIVQYASSTIFDFGIFIITAGRLYRLYVFGRTKLAKIILQDCLWYFMALAWLSLAGMLLFICLPPERATISAVIANLARTISVIITTRIVLNLRSFVSNPGATLTLDNMTSPPVIGSGYTASTGGSTTVFTKQSSEWSPQQNRRQGPILAKVPSQSGDLEMPIYSPRK